MGARVARESGHRSEQAADRTEASTSVGTYHNPTFQRSLPLRCRRLVVLQWHPYIAYGYDSFLDSVIPIVDARQAVFYGRDHVVETDVVLARPGSLPRGARADSTRLTGTRCSPEI